MGNSEGHYESMYSGQNPAARKCKIPDKFLEYTLCENLHNCTYGERCYFPHSTGELREWNLARTRHESKKESVRPLQSSAKMQMCPERGNCDRGHSCQYAHSNIELSAWRKISGTKLLGSLVYVRSNSWGTHKTDPFCVGVLDFQRRFIDALSPILLEMVKGMNYRSIPSDLADTNEYDLYNLLHHIKKNAAKYANFLRIGHQQLVFTCQDLLKVRNELSHQMYAGEQSAESTPQQTILYTWKSMEKGIELASKINDRVLRSRGKSWMFRGLESIRESFLQYSAYLQRLDERMRYYHPNSGYGPSNSDKLQLALRVLEELHSLVLAESSPGEVTEFVATTLAARCMLSESHHSSESRPQRPDDIDAFMMMIVLAALLGTGLLFLMAASTAGRF